jgi:hypothetical protein
MTTVECNTMAAKEHVSKAERTIRTIKERTRGLITTLPFRYIPRRMKFEFYLFHSAVTQRIPSENGGISNLLTAGAARQVVARLQETLQSSTGNLPHYP